MAYITNYTLKKLARNLDFKEDIDVDIFVNHIYNDARIFYFFNKSELRYLFNMKFLIKNRNIKYFEFVEERKDTKTYINEYTHKLTYHLYKSCERLNQDFNGFLIPPEVEEADLIDELRDWFEENDFEKKFREDEINLSTIIMRYNMGFAKRHNLEELNVKYKLLVFRKNSNNTFTPESFDEEKFTISLFDALYYKSRLLDTDEKKKLGNLEWLQFKTDKEIKEKIVEKFGKKFWKKFRKKYIKSLWKEYRAIKIGLVMNPLLDYIKWKYGNPSGKYKKSTLEDFNLRCCSVCEEMKFNKKIVKKENKKTKKKRHNEKDDLPF